MEIKTLLLTGCMIVLAACNESKYDLENLVPEQYHKILYVVDSGRQEVTLVDTEDDYNYTFSIVKAGSDPEQTASVYIQILTQVELDSKYSKPEDVNYRVIQENCYTLETTHLDFLSADLYKTITISLKPQHVKTAMENNPEVIWVLPLMVTSETDSINAEKNELFLLLTDVVSPSLGFTDPSFNLKQYEYGSVPAISENIEMSLDTDNKWNIEYELKADEEYIATFNGINKTVYNILPQGTYTFPESMTLPNGTTKTLLSITINGEELEPGDYMLPIRITNISQFEISSSNGIYPLAIRIVAPQLNRTGWTAEANTEEASGEGAGNGLVACVLDGDLSTYWHSQWSGSSDGLPHELIIDTKEEYTFAQFGMIQRQSEGQTDTAGGEFYVSSDKENWTKVGNFAMEKILDLQVFSITPTKGRYFKIKITQSHRDIYTSLSEVYAYGIK